MTTQQPNIIGQNAIAELYGVETKHINKAVKNNLDKFPEGYLMELTDTEWIPLKSQIATSDENSLRSQSVTLESQRGTPRIHVI